jgi:hypothetical protein
VVERSAVNATSANRYRKVAGSNPAGSAKHLFMGDIQLLLNNLFSEAEHANKKAVQ